MLDAGSHLEQGQLLPGHGAVVRRGQPGAVARARALRHAHVLPGAHREMGHAGERGQPLPLRCFCPVLVLTAVAPRPEPGWIRAQFGLRLDLTVTFIDEKAVTATDLNSQKNRFRLPTAGVLHSLSPLLSPEELDAASIPRNGAMVVPRLPRSPPTEEEEVQQGSIKKRKKKQGKKHGGLPVVVCNVHAGTKQLQLTRWESSHGNIIKGEGYLDFITRCCFKEKDVVEIWAFKERRFHLFGVDMCHASPLHVVLAKKEQRQPASIGMGKCTM
ncbi:hypothetical protein ZWY2020_004264 [Hordeum vulgare]|nr:hypothetical protein ZWY2020_004264 [Hordeum vulgare]